MLTNLNGGRSYVNKTTSRALMALVVLASAICFSGCSWANKKSETKHRLRESGIAGPGFVAVPMSVDQGHGYQVTPVSNNLTKAKSFVLREESWTDHDKGGGIFLATDPKASHIEFLKTNSAALGGSHHFSLGGISISTTNTAKTIGAVGDAVGTIGEKLEEGAKK